MDNLPIKYFTKSIPGVMVYHFFVGVSYGIFGGSSPSHHRTVLNPMDKVATKMSQIVSRPSLEASNQVTKNHLQ
jgi:hypothetical protein